MDPRLLRLYSDELSHLREVGAEFAREFPKIAARLGVEGMEVTDPYVERLLEGFAFLTARVQLKLEAEQPRLIAHLLEVDLPELPRADAVDAWWRASASIRPIRNLGSAATPCRAAAPCPRKSPRGQDTHCEFTTAHEVILWPIELASVQYFSFAPDLAAAKLPQLLGMRGGLRIRLRCGGGLRFDQLGLDRLSFYISAPDDVAFRLHELVLGATERHAGARRRGRRRRRRQRGAVARQREPSAGGIRRRRSAVARIAARASPAIACCRRSRRCRSGCSSSRSAISPIACAASRATKSSSSCCSAAATRRSKP